MTHHQTEHNTDASFEATPGPEPPRIYLASLSDFNAGLLHGSWIDATQPTETIWEDIDQMLKTSLVPQAEEWAIHDHCGFTGWQPSEYESIETVAAVATAIAEHGTAIGEWISYLGDVEQAIATFEDAYLGQWDSLNDYAEHLTEELGVTITVEPESWAHYVGFDTQALARDLSIELHTTPDTNGGVHVFEPGAA